MHRVAGEIIKGIPFDASQIVSPEGELTYDYLIFAQDVADWWSNFYTNGILVPDGRVINKEYKVEQSDETSIVINTGSICVNGRLGTLKTAYPFTIESAGSGMQRIDRVVIELNLREAVNEFRPILLTGTESSENATPPEITRDDLVYQMSLAQIHVDATGITQIVDERIYDELCGLCQVLVARKPAMPVTGDTANNIAYDNTSTGMEAVNVQEAIDELHGNIGGNVSLATMFSSVWDADNKTYSFETNYPNSQYNLEIALDQTASEQQQKAWNKANILGSATSNVVKAMGEVPTVNIPIILEVSKK